MADNKLLQQIGELFTIHTAQIRKELTKEIKASEERIKKELRTEFKQVITESKEDTIETLSQLFHEGHNVHEKRIKRIEDHLHLSPTQ